MPKSNINIKLSGNGLDITDAIHNYEVERVTNLGKLLSKQTEEALIDFQVVKMTNHHKSGEIFRADCKILLAGKSFFSSSQQEDLYAAIDDVKEKLFNEIKKSQKKNQDLWRRGARSVKKMIRGISKRNPFTSKY